MGLCGRTKKNKGKFFFFCFFVVLFSTQPTSLQRHWFEHEKRKINKKINKKMRMGMVDLHRFESSFGEFFWVGK
jgi:hypothetical protein